MTQLRYLDVSSRRQRLAENLLATARSSALSLQDNGKWVQLANTHGPHVMLSIHADDEHASALAAVHGLMRQLDTLSDEQSPSLEALLQTLDTMLDTHTRHHIQL